MANATSIKAALANCNDGDKLVVVGDILYGQNMATPLEGDALTKEIAREEQYSKHPEYILRDPKIRFTLSNPKIAKQGAQPSDLEKAMAARIYVGKDGVQRLDYEKRAPKRKDGTVFCPIAFGVKGKDGKIHKVDLSGKDLANGQAVTLTFEVFTSKYGKGLSLRTIVFNEEPKLYQPNLPEGWVEDEPADNAADNGNGVGDDLFA